MSIYQKMSKEDREHFKSIGIITDSPYERRDRKPSGYTLSYKLMGKVVKLKTSKQYAYCKAQQNKLEKQPQYKNAVFSILPEFD